MIINPAGKFHTTVIAIVSIPPGQINEATPRFDDALAKTIKEVTRRHRLSSIHFKGISLGPDGAGFAQGHMSDESMFVLRDALEETFPAPNRRTPFIHSSLFRIERAMSPQRFAALFHDVESMREMEIGEFTPPEGELVFTRDDFGLHQVGKSITIPLGSSPLYQKIAEYKEFKESEASSSPVVFNEEVFTGDLARALTEFIGREAMEKLSGLFDELENIEGAVYKDMAAKEELKKEAEKRIEAIVDEVNARATLAIVDDLEVADIVYVEDHQGNEATLEAIRALENGELMVEILAGGAATRMKKSLVKAGINLPDKDYRIWTLDIGKILDEVRKDRGIVQGLEAEIASLEKKARKAKEDKSALKELKGILASVKAIKALKEKVERKNLGVRHLEALNWLSKGWRARGRCEEDL